MYLLTAEQKINPGANFAGVRENCIDFRKVDQIPYIMTRTIDFQPWKVTRILLGFVGLLVVGNIITVVRLQLPEMQTGQAGAFIRLFNFNTTENLVSVFSAFIHLISALLILLIASSVKPGLKQRKYWNALSGVFFFFMLDELILLRQLLRNTLHRLAGMLGGTLFAGFALLIAGLLLIGGYLFFTRLFLKLPRRTQRQFIISGGIFVAGAIGMDAVGNYYYLYNEADLAYGLLSTLEEAMEMLGVVLFIHALLNYCIYQLNATQIQLHFRLQDEQAEVATRSIH